MLQLNVDLNNKIILVTGAAGFIGSFLCERLLKEYPTSKIIGIDSITDYYDISLKHHRLGKLKVYDERFIFVQDSIANKQAIDEIFLKYKPSVVVNLAAQAGVRYSITNPDAYIESNIIGF